MCAFVKDSLGGAANEMAEEDMFVDARDWEKEIEEVKSELESTKREVTKVNKKAISWEREAKDIRKQYERERNLKMETALKQWTVESEVRIIQRELEGQLKDRDEIITVKMSHYT